MKKYILLSALTISLPVYAVCSVTGGACSLSSNWESKSINQRLVPDNLQDLKRTDAFQPSYRKPYYDMLINTEEEKTTLPPENNYNSNCQFGVCLPGVEPGEDVLE